MCAHTQRPHRAPGRVRARSLRALCSEGALCTGALCAGAVPAVLPSEHSIVFMCARTHKGHIVPMVVFVLAACERGPRRPQGCVASDETRLFLLKPLSGRRHASAAWRASSQSRLLPRTGQPAGLQRGNVFDGSGCDGRGHMRNLFTRRLLGRCQHLVASLDKLC